MAECRKRFAAMSNAEFAVGSGCDLKMISSTSIDGIWSFDVFVHINSDEFRSYIREFQRVLRDGGVVVIHHGSVGGCFRTISDRNFAADSSPSSTDASASSCSMLIT